MKNFRDTLLLREFRSKNNMFDFEHNINLFYVSEVLRFKMYRRIKKYDLNYYEDAILDLIHLTVNIIEMINLKKHGLLQEIKKLYQGVIQYKNDSDTECESIEYGDFNML